MSLVLLSGSANHALAEGIARVLATPLGSRILKRFPDGELHVAIQESLRGHDVYLLQPTCAPVEAHLVELLLLADAARRAGAARLTAVMPYFGYARQDRRASGREPVSARLVATLLEAGGLDRVVGVDLHSPAIEGFFTIPCEHVSAIPLLAEAARPFLTPESIVVAPDLGSTKLAERYATTLDLPVAIVHKTRVTSEKVSVRRITGDVRGRRPVIVDDMISTAGTVDAALDALIAAGSEPSALVVATHGLFVGPAAKRLASPRVERLIVTDSVPPPKQPLPTLELVSLAPMLADVVWRLHEDRSLRGVLEHR